MNRRYSRSGVAMGRIRSSGLLAMSNEILEVLYGRHGDNWRVVERGAKVVAMRRLGVERMAPDTRKVSCRMQHSRCRI